VKVTSGFDASNFIPGHKVAYAFGDLQVAVRAYPGFPVIRIGANAGLGRVFDPTLDFVSTKTETQSI
jgi:hypothetical protein